MKRCICISEENQLQIIDQLVTLSLYPANSKSEERANMSTLPFDLKVIPVLVPPISNNEKATNKENNTCYNEKHVTFENIHLDNQTIVGKLKILYMDFCMSEGSLISFFRG